MRKVASILIVLLLLSVALNGWQWHKLSNADSGRSDTIRVTDTIRYTEVIPKDSVVVEYITRTLRTVDTIVVRDTILDSVRVEIPITQKTYRDSLYVAWVSGYEAKLDSIEVYRHETIIRQKPKRWSFGMQAGYGVTKAGLSPYVGFGIGYKLPP